MHDTTIFIDFETDASALRRGPTGYSTGTRRCLAWAGSSGVLTGTRTGTHRYSRGYSACYAREAEGRTV